jgi:hypothetical protein
LTIFFVTVTFTKKVNSDAAFSGYTAILKSVTLFANHVTGRGSKVDLECMECFNAATNRIDIYDQEDNLIEVLDLCEECYQEKVRQLEEKS